MRKELIAGLCALAVIASPCEASAQSDGAAWAQANASSALLNFEADMAPVYRDGVMAGYALACGLRSGQWYGVIAAGVSMMLTREAARAHLSPAERDAANTNDAPEWTPRGLSLHSSSAGDIRRVCVSLLHDEATMDRLDRIEYRLRGGYH